MTFDGSTASVVKYGIIQFLRGNKISRALTAVLAVGMLVLGVVIFIGLTRIPQYASIMLGFGAFQLLWLVTIAGNEFTLTFPIQDATKERQKAEQDVKESKDPNDILTLDFKRLNEYYVINQNQAKSSFRWAVFAMLFGFATIVSGIWLFYFKRDVPDTFMASLSTAAGVVVNLVSGMFLYLHHKTQERSLHYYGQLSRIQNVALAIRLVEAQPDDEAKIESRNKVIDQLLKTHVIHNDSDQPNSSLGAAEIAG